MPVEAGTSEAMSWMEDLHTGRGVRVNVRVADNDRVDVTFPVDRVADLRA